MNDFKCSTNYADKTLLTMAKEEIPIVLDRVREIMHTDTLICDALRLFKLYFTPSIIQNMISWVNSTAKKSKLKVTENEIWGFIYVDCLIMFYSISPTEFYKSKNRIRYPVPKTKLLPHKRYKFIMRALNKGPKALLRNKLWKSPVHRCDEIVHVLKEFSRHCSQIGFFKSMYIAIDDDVQRKRSKSVRDYAVTQTNNPKKRMGIVHHASVSVMVYIWVVTFKEKATKHLTA
jgi:Transposase IS4